MRVRSLLGLVLATFVWSCQVPLSEDAYHVIRNEPTGVEVVADFTFLINDNPRRVGFVTPEGVQATARWVSSDPTVATVDQAGVVSPLTFGTTQISAALTLQSGEEVSRSLVVKVDLPVVSESSPSAIVSSLVAGSGGEVLAVPGYSTSSSSTIWPVYRRSGNGAWDSNSQPATGLTQASYYGSYSAFLVSGPAGLILCDASAQKLYWLGADRAVTQSHSGYPGVAGGPWPVSKVAGLGPPLGVISAADGTVYFSDSNRIRRLSVDGQVTTIAGNGNYGGTNGQGSSARFYDPQSLAWAPDGALYVAEPGAYRIRKVTTDGTVTTFAGGTYGSANGVGTAAQFRSPAYLAVSADGTLYVADGVAVRKITPGGVVSTLAGSTTSGSNDGVGTAAKFSELSGISVGTDGTVTVIDGLPAHLRSIAPDGTVTTVSATLPSYARSLVGLPDGTFRFCSLHTIYATTAAGDWTVLAGSGSYGLFDGTGSSASFYNPRGLALAPSGSMIVADYSNYRLRKVTQDGVTTTLAGVGSGTVVDGAVSAAPLRKPLSGLSGPDGTLYIGDGLLDGIVVLRPDGTSTVWSGFDEPRGLALDGEGNLFVADGGLRKILRRTPAGVVTTWAGSGITGSVDGAASTAQFSGPSAMVRSEEGELWVVDSNRIRRINGSGTVTTVVRSAQWGADGGSASTTYLSYPCALAFADEKTLLVADGAKVWKLQVKR